MIWGNLLHLGYNMWEDRDEPDLEARRAQPYLRCEPELWRGLTQQMAGAGLNLLVIDLGEGVRFESHPELAVAGSWTTSQLRAELRRLRALGLEPIPKMNFSTTHDAWLGEYARMVSTARYYEVLRDLIAEACALFEQPRFFHLGMDEETAENQRYDSCAIIRQHELWWHDFYFMIEQVEKGGARPWIWADYVWHHADEFFRKMPRSVVQSNWYYGEEFSGFSGTDAHQNELYVRAYRQLEEHGFDQIPTGSNWSYAHNFERTVEFCRQHIAPERLLGFLTAPWHPTLESYRAQHEAAIAQVQAVRCRDESRAK